MENPELHFRLAARVLIVNNENKLLLVANSERMTWFTPGGRTEPEETLEEAAIRETYEETGIKISGLKLVYVREATDDRPEKMTHHICFYFFARTAETLPETWEDHDGYVDLNKFFTEEELKSEPKVWPDILRDKFWADLKTNFKNSELYSKYTITHFK